MYWRKLTGIRNLAIFAVLLGVCLFAPSALRDGAKGVFEQFRAPVDSLSSQFSDLAAFWSMASNSKRDLIEAGRDLARLNAGFQVKNLESDSLKMQIGRLEKILGMPSYEKFKPEVARVCRRDVNAWWQRLVIRKGSAHGIKKGYAVICASGVVGRIAEVGADTSVVELVSSRQFRMAARAEGDERPIIYQGAGSLSMHAAKGEISDVPADLSASPSKPLRLFTSSLAGSFPDGVLIGEVVSLKPEPDGIFKSGSVRLAKGLSSVREVSVLIPIADVKVR